MSAPWSPEAPACDVEAMVWAPASAEYGVLESVQAADGVTRGQAALRFAEDEDCPGAYTDVRVVKRWVRPLTYREAWRGYVARLRADGGIDEGDPAPDDPPHGWTPDEYGPFWTFVPPGEGVAVWVCRWAGTNAPPNPRWRAGVEVRT